MRQGSRCGANEAQSRPSRRRPRPIPLAPTIGDGLLVTRWGHAGSATVAAFELQSGLVRWGWDGNLTHTRDVPASPPLLHEGRVYFTCGRETAGDLNVACICLDAQTGVLLWRTELGGGRSGDAKPSRSAADGASRGASTSRPGLASWPVWMRLMVSQSGRRSTRPGGPRNELRVGSAPVVTDGLVICSPRDYHGLFALQQSNGELRWEARLAPAQEVLGTMDGQLVTYGTRHVAAYTVQTGELRWSRRLAEGVLPTPTLLGNQVHVPAVDGIHVFTGTDGEHLKTTPYDSSGVDCVLAGYRWLHAGRLGRRCSVASDGQHTRDFAARVSEPLPRRWPEHGTSPCPPLASIWPWMRHTGDDRVYVKSGPALHAYEIGADAPNLVWSLGLQRAVKYWFRAGNKLILVHAYGVMALAAESGAPAWTFQSPFKIDAATLEKDDLVLAGESGNIRQLAWLSAQTGKAHKVCGLADMPAAPQLGLIRDGDRLRVYAWHHMNQPYKTHNSRHHVYRYAELVPGSLPPRWHTIREVPKLSRHATYLVRDDYLWWVERTGKRTAALLRMPAAGGENEVLIPELAFDDDHMISFWLNTRDDYLRIWSAHHGYGRYSRKPIATVRLDAPTVPWTGLSFRGEHPVRHERVPHLPPEPSDGRDRQHVPNTGHPPQTGEFRHRSSSTARLCRCGIAWRDQTAA